MKTIKNKIASCLLAVLVLMVSGCKETGLEDFGEGAPKVVMISALGQGGAIVKEATSVSIPLDVALSVPAASAFEVELQDSRETIQAMLDNGSLKDAVLLPAGTYTFPNVLNVPYGIKKASFNVVVNINTLEKNYGKRIAFAVKLNSPSKGNAIEANKETFIIVVDTKDILAADDIRYISIEGANEQGRYMVPTGKNYTISSAGIVIPIKLKLSGNAGGPAFSVKVTLNQDTLGPMLGQLPAPAIPTNPAVFSIPKEVKFAANQTEAILNITFPLDYINATVCCNNIISINISDATKNLINPLKKNMLVIVKSADLAEKDVTNDGTLSVSKENDGGRNSGEGSLKVIDRSVNTKYLTSGFSGLWIQLKYANPLTIGAYTMTSGNDADDRDPKTWTFEGSQDGTNWKVLDTRIDHVFTDRTQTKRFEFTNRVSYLYYRLNISENNGSGDFQMSELRLFQLP